MNIDTKGGIFLSHPQTNKMDYISCSPLNNASLYLNELLKVTEYA